MATELGTIASLWRYPVKSMRGEEVPAAALTEYGLLGDRAYALIDSTDGKVATAKNPGKWPTLFAFRATFPDQPNSGAALPAVRITLPDGSTLSSTAGDCHQILSRALNREVTLAAAERGRVTGLQAPLPATWTGQAEEYWPDMEGLDHRDTVTDFALSPDGRLVVAALQKSDALAAFRVDAEAGILARLPGSALVPSPACVVFAPPEPLLRR